MKARNPSRLPKLPGGEIRGVNFSKTGSKMAFYLNGDRSPSNLFSYDFKTKSHAARKVSQRKSTRPICGSRSRALQVLRRHGDSIDLPLPHGASTTNKVPAVVFVHGVLADKTTRGYSSIMQYLANNGYAVLGINNRGSSGYGKTFFAADDRKHGREPL